MDGKWNDTISKSLLMFLGVILVLGLVPQLLSGFGAGNMMMNQGYGGFNGFLPGLFLLMMKLLWLVVLVGVAAGLFSIGKKYIAKNGSFQTNNVLGGLKSNEYKCPNCDGQLSEEFKFCPNCKKALNNICTCGQELQLGWKYCPRCGRETH